MGKESIIAHLTKQISTKQTSHRLFILPAIVIIIGLCISIDAEMTQNAEDNKQIELALKRDLTKFKSQIIQRLTFYSYGLKSLDSLIHAVGEENFNYEVIQSFARSRDFQTEFPGVRGFGFIQNVGLKDLDSFINKQRVMRPDGTFEVKHLSEDYSHLFIIRYILPENKNSLAIGLNIGSEDTRRTAAINAISRNDITITAPITLVQADKSLKQGFLILMPFSSRDTDTTSEVLTLENIWGWTYAPIVIEEVVNSIDSIDSNLAFSIYNNHQTDDSLFFQSAEIEQQYDSKSHYQNTSVFGSNWRFEVHPTHAFINQIRKQAPYTVFAQSMVATLLGAITLFCLHLILIKRFESNAHIAELTAAKENALKDANKKLESLIVTRTQEIKQSAILKEAILQSSAYTIIATDEDGLITVFNPASEKLLGYQATEIIGKENPGKFHVLEEVIERAKLLSEEANENIEPGFRVFTYKAILHGKEESRWTYVHRNGKHINVRLSITSLFDENNNIIGFLGMAYDLTEQLANEQAIKTEKEKAETANLVKSQFLANMSHEIRTPLNGIQGALQILQDKALTSDLSSLVNIALRSMKSLSLLINDILDVSKVEAGKIQLAPRAFRIDELLDSLYQELNNSAESKGINLRFVNALSYKTWIGDDLRIKQILTNLISNAIKFTEQGTVAVYLDYARNNELKFKVTDTGIGMESAGLSVLFNRFEQADQSITRKFGGTGLGMAITKSLVELMQGTLHVSSEINVGSTFEVYLPLKSLEEDVISDIEPSEVIRDFSNFSILVAEDNEINQVIVKTMLSDIGAHLV